jgi:hypothetical protein
MRREPGDGRLPSDAVAARLHDRVAGWPFTLRAGARAASPPKQAEDGFVHGQREPAPRCR